MQQSFSMFLTRVRSNDKINTNNIKKNKKEAPFMLKMNDRLTF